MRSIVDFFALKCRTNALKRRATCVVIDPPSMSPVCLHGVLFVILVMNLPEILLAHLTIYNNRSYPFKYNLYMDASLQSLLIEKLR